ncbi:type I-E CRISPR-associated protein Cse2/CasB [Umezawaea sp. NPDC059074]|uniref:type I-E CRISPR-associated protein Cse2/CasB n=1 Tax=Umezawaea sp. NPDC059074 TaxID=3346716 RepID=UPI00368702F1
MSDPLAQRRDAFIDQLHKLHHGASSGIAKHQSDCRAQLARLRRSLNGPQYQVDAYEFLFKQNPPETEQETWLLVAGLFATHPQPGRSGRRSLGTSMRDLRAKRTDSATRRFQQLLGRDRRALPHHLRQTIRLLASDSIPVNYGQLLDDLVVLLGERYREPEAHRVRLKWARDFHLPDIKPTKAATSTGTPIPSSSENQ